MAGATLSTVDAILKEIYGPRIEEQLQDEVVLKKRIERSSDGVVETVGGKYVDFPIRVTRNHGMGYRSEEEQLPAAGKQGYAEVHVPLKYGYGRVRLTAQLMTLADKKYQAFASAMNREMEGLKDDISKDQNRICYQPFGNSVLAVVNGTTSSTATLDVTNAQYLEVGMFVDLIDTGTGLPKANGTNRTISAVDVDANTFTISGSADQTEENDGTMVVCRTGSYGREPTGIASIVAASGALHGVNPSSQPEWKSTVMDNSGTNRALSEGLMIQAVDKVRVKGGKTSVILTSLGVRRAYFNLLTQQRRYTNTKDFAGGFTGLAFHHGREIPVVEDVDAPPNKMWGLEESKLKVYRNKQWHWADEDGSTLKWVQDYDVWEGFMREFSEMGTSKRNSHFLISDITEG